MFGSSSSATGCRLRAFWVLRQKSAVSNAPGAYAGRQPAAASAGGRRRPMAYGRPRPTMASVPPMRWGQEGS